MIFYRLEIYDAIFAFLSSPFIIVDLDLYIIIIYIKTISSIV